MTLKKEKYQSTEIHLKRHRCQNQQTEILRVIINYTPSVQEGKEKHKHVKERQERNKKDSNQTSSDKIYIKYSRQDNNIIIKMPKVKDKENLKSAREKQLVAYKGAPTRLSLDFSIKILQAREIGTKHSK